jgi:hypothetical protein
MSEGNRNRWVICSCFLRYRSDKDKHKSYLQIPLNQNPLDAPTLDRYHIFLDVYEEIHRTMRTYEQVQARISAETAVKSKKLNYLTEPDIQVLKAYGLM